MRNCYGKVGSAFKDPTAATVGANEVCVAAGANCAFSVSFATRPEIAQGEAAEDCWSSGMVPFALQCVEDFRDSVSRG